MNEPYRLRYTNQIVGFFLLIVFVITTAVAVLLFSQLLVRKETFFVNVSEAEASELRTGTDVIVLGQTIGQVEQLRYVPDSDQVRVQLAIDSQFSDQITSDSEVTLKRRFGVGAPVLSIRRKPPGQRSGAAGSLQPGQAIGSFRGDGDPIENIAADVETAGGSIDVAAKKLTESLEQSIDPAFQQSSKTFESWLETSETLREETDRTLAQIRNTTLQLELQLTQLTERIDQLVDEDIRATVARIQQSAQAATAAAASVQKTAATIESKSEQTNDDVALTLKTLRETATLVQRLTNESRDVVRIVRREADDLPGTAERVNDTVDDTQDLVGDIRDHWLLRRLRDDQDPSKQVSPSSLRSGGVR
ncbi:MlaD family protein [Stieleria sp. TO1_6]|uniref:MlaD family protein n=1 Tax=Stieleria tagensis TaxID=2956795 RepID=UPI00209AC2C4|nr:MlaD family protein [Stieleria tagensis]MCO8122059.1 MlaD family protein [Stieleria tagensis]